MHDELRELYQQVILDHQRSPRNFRKIESPDRRADGFNPLCGDRIHVDLKLGDDSITDVAFTGAGCAICTASASLMSEALKGLTQNEAEAMFERFHQLLTEETPVDQEPLGKLAVFAGVREFPVRVKCATLPWHTFHAALTGDDVSVTTE